MEFTDRKTSFLTLMSLHQTKQEIMRERLQKGLSPKFLHIENQSALHSGHMGDDGTGETHYKITISSEHLDTLSRLQQHKLILKFLGTEITSNTHSISIKVK